ncbi:hypothetical protein [Hymenobacter sp.]|jgi:hypothetical protein|uniref:hypothetical protein n=1 Tax=Hymenobacter sp. TaxID=1898978 RepID=UPI002ED7764B
MKKYLIGLVGALMHTGNIVAQEIPKGATTLRAELGQGFTRPRGGPELYLATLQFALEKTIVPEQLRAGLVAGAFHPGRLLGGFAGGRATLKVFQLPSLLLAKAGHVQVLAEYLPLVYVPSNHWRQWVGVGIGVETSNLLGIALKFHRDTRTPTTYGQVALTYNLLHKSPPQDL